jgi:hypothetical protein
MHLEHACKSRYETIRENTHMNAQTRPISHAMESQKYRSFRFTARVNVGDGSNRVLDVREA